MTDQKKSATEPAETAIGGCNCASYNNPERVRPTVSGPVPEVVLTPPFDLGDGRTTVCVDACIATVVVYLWGCEIVTLGSCCGHGRDRPSLVLGQHEDMAVVRVRIAEVDDRTWDLSQWRLVENPGWGQPVSDPVKALSSAVERAQTNGDCLAAAVDEFLISPATSRRAVADLADAVAIYRASLPPGWTP